MNDKQATEDYGSDLCERILPKLIEQFWKHVDIGGDPDLRSNENIRESFMVSGRIAPFVDHELNKDFTYWLITSTYANLIMATANLEKAPMLSDLPSDTYIRETKKSALDTQVGGSHYKDMPIQPMTYSLENGLNAAQHTVVKYVTRYQKKGGIQDLEKARHTIDLLIEFERGKEQKHD